MNQSVVSGNKSHLKKSAPLKKDFLNSTSMFSSTISPSNHRHKPSLEFVVSQSSSSSRRSSSLSALRWHVCGGWWFCRVDDKDDDDDKVLSPPFVPCFETRTTPNPKRGRVQLRGEIRRPMMMMMMGGWKMECMLLVSNAFTALRFSIVPFFVITVSVRLQSWKAKGNENIKKIRKWK